MEWQGIAGFLPASQSKTDHYPRVIDGDKDKILEELKKLIGSRITVSLITASPKEGKLIFSEKGVDDKRSASWLSTTQREMLLRVMLTGIVDFGVFVKIEDGLEGLVHISEIDWGLVEDPRAFFKVGDRIKVKIVDIKDGKISLSVKQLRENPWKEAAAKYKKGDDATGVIIKYNKHGALASIVVCGRRAGERRPRTDRLPRISGELEEAIAKAR